MSKICIQRDQPIIQNWLFSSISVLFQNSEFIIVARLIEWLVTINQQFVNVKLKQSILMKNVELFLLEKLKVMFEKGESRTNICFKFQGKKKWSFQTTAEGWNLITAIITLNFGSEPANFSVACAKHDSEHRPCSVAFPSQAQSWKL